MRKYLSEELQPLLGKMTASETKVRNLYSPSLSYSRFAEVHMGRVETTSCRSCSHFPL